MSLFFWLLGGSGPAPVATQTVTATLEAALDVYKNTVLKNGAVGYWRVDEALGTVMADSSGNDYDGVYVGGVTLGQAGALADNDAAITLDGVSGYAKVPDTLALRITGSLSIEAWVKYTDLTNFGFIVSKVDGPGYNGYELFRQNGTGKLRFSSYQLAGPGNLVFDIQSPANYNNGLWHHVVGTFDGTTAILYVDGVSVVSGGPSAFPLVASTSELRIGQRSGDGGSFFNGSVDDVSVYNVVLSPTQVAALRAARLASKWTNILDDARAQSSIVCEYGIHGNTPTDRIADTGKLDFLLDNSTLYGLLGRHSPLHVNRRPGFDFNVPIRWGFTSGTLTAYKFLGSLADIVPLAGVHDARTVACTAVDKMDEYANLDLPDLPVQFGQRPDQLITTVLNALGSTDQPFIRDIDLGSETYEMALDGGATGTQPKVREVLNQLALSELGYVYFKGNSYSGGVFTFENRHRRSLSLTPALSLVDLDPGGFSVPGSRDDIFSRVQVLVRPTRVDPSPTTVLYSLQTTSTQLRPGETNSTLFGPYRDPNNTGIQIGGTETIDPAPVTDYTMNSLADGTGSDLTASFTVLASRTGLGVRFTITNLGLVPGFITKLQVRGKGIYRSLTTIDVAVPSGYGNRIFVLDMPFQTDVNVASDVAYYTANILSRPLARVPSARFLANLTPELMLNAILREPGDRVHIREEMTGVDDDFYINSVRLELVEGHLLWCTWGLAQANTTQFWFIGVSGFTEIGETTVLGF